jgi:HK97 gp10 family phage protein
MPLNVVTVSNLFPEIADALPGGAHRLLLDAAQAIYLYSQEIVPVDTGALKDSGHIDDRGENEVAVVYGGGEAVNTSGQSYADYVEYGTRFMAAQPYLAPAAEVGLETLQAEADNLLIEFGG